MFTPVSGVAESRILVIAGADTMRIDLPDDLRPLIDRTWTRWDGPSPDVTRSKMGRWDVYTCINECQAGVATHQFISKRLQEEAHWLPPPQIEPPPGIQPPELLPSPPSPKPEAQRPQTPEDWEAYCAEQPPLKEVRIDRVSADTVRVRITGRVMLNGGCASGMPLFGIEMRTDTGWVKRIPFDMPRWTVACPGRTGRVTG